MRSIFSLLTAVLFVLSLSLATTPEAEAFQTPIGESGTEYVDPVSPGTMDFTVGLGGLLYNWIEPGASLGLIPISDIGVLSVGGTVNVGYCLVGCGIFNAFLRPVRIDAWHITPMGRAQIHLNVFARSLNIPEIDVFGGLAMGPNYTNASIRNTETNAVAEWSGFSFLVGPLIGMRYVPGGDRGLFFYGEVRYFAEFGRAQFRLSDTDGTYYDHTDLISRGGRSQTFGLGFRF